MVLMGDMQDMIVVQKIKFKIVLESKHGRCIDGMDVVDASF
jgi:hypothetical protein